MKIWVLLAVQRVLSWIIFVFERFEAKVDDRITVLEIRKNYGGKR